MITWPELKRSLSQDEIDFIWHPNKWQVVTWFGGTSGTFMQRDRRFSSLHRIITSGWALRPKDVEPFCWTLLQHDHDPHSVVWDKGPIIETVCGTGNLEGLHRIFGLTGCIHHATYEEWQRTCSPST